MSGNDRVATARAAECVSSPAARRVPLYVRLVWWLLRGAARWVWRGLVFAAWVLAFVAEPVDELVTARLGIAPVLPRIARGWRWWRHQIRTRWRDRRDGVITAELTDTDGVWR